MDGGDSGFNFLYPYHFVFNLHALLKTPVFLIAKKHLGWNSLLVAALPGMCIVWYIFVHLAATF